MLASLGPRASSSRATASAGVELGSRRILEGRAERGPRRVAS